MIGEDLETVGMAQEAGTLCLAGYAEGGHWYEYSIDRGATAAPFAGGDTRRWIADAPASRPAVALHPSGIIVVAFERGGSVAVYYSADGGEHWSPVEGVG